MKSSRLLIVALSLVSGIAHAQNKVSILVPLTPAGTFTASSDQVTGSLVKSGSEFKADKLAVTVKTLKTGIGLRDQHLWKHLNADQHPQVILTDLKGSNGNATANLEVNGVKKPVTLSFQDVGNQVKATLNLKPSDFKLPPAKYLGVGVKDSVKADVNVKYTVQAAAKK